MFGIPVEEAALAAVIVAAGALVQGTIGFGMAVLAAPLLVLVNPGYVPGPMLITAFVLTALVLHRERQTIDLRGVGWALAGRVPGTLVGLGAMVLLSAAMLSRVFAAMVLLAVALAASGMHVEPRRTTQFAAGFVSGAMGTVSSIGGPPMAILYQHSAGPTLRGTLASYFIVGTIMSASGLYLVGKFGMDELARVVVLVPGAVVGFVLSGWTRGLSDRGYTRAGVLLISALAALGALARNL